MSSTTNETTNRFHNRIAIALTVFLSLALPAAVIGWSIISKTWGHYVDETSRFDADYVFCIWPYKDGELWYWFGTKEGKASSFSNLKMKRRDLQTGMDSESGVTLRHEQCLPFFLKDQLYILDWTDHTLDRVIDGRPERLPNMPNCPKQIYLLPFLFNGQLSTIAVADDGGFQLVHLVDGQWIMGRKVLLPAPGRSWSDSGLSEGTTLWPLTSKRSNSAASIAVAGNWLHLEVIEDSGTVNLFVTDNNDFNAYRSGFEYCDARPDIASALVPENSDREISGWKPIPFTVKNAFCHSMGCDKNGILFLIASDPFCKGAHRYWLVRCNTHGVLSKPQEITISPNRYGRRNYLVTNQDETISYIVQTSQSLEMVTVWPIEGDRVQPGKIEFQGSIPFHMIRWTRLLIFLASAWLLHLTVLMGGLFIRYDRDSKYYFGIQVATIAPAWRRVVAFGFDFALGLSALCLLTFLLLLDLRIEWKQWSPIDLGNWLADFEYQFMTGRFIDSPWSNPIWECGILNLLPPPLVNCPEFYVIGFIAILVMLFFRAYLEGRSGVTPGKWLLGIRTLNSTLRPCGFARALLGNLFFWIDTPLMITPLPAAVSIMASERRQRLGNRVADTVVVVAGSIHEREISQSK